MEHSEEGESSDAFSVSSEPKAYVLGESPSNDGPELSSCTVPKILSFSCENCSPLSCSNDGDRRICMSPLTLKEYCESYISDMDRPMLTTIEDPDGHLLLSQVIGVGGDRGSRVYQVTAEQLIAVDPRVKTWAKRPMAYKVYEKSISRNELMFIERANPNRLDEDCGHVIFYGFLHLALPIALVHYERSFRGLLMRQYPYTLKSIMESSVWEDDLEDVGTKKSFLITQRYKPIHSACVITALSYQLLTAIRVCNHVIEHQEDGVFYSGYTHNDIHLENLLLNDNGKLVLCDFELVTPLNFDGPPPVQSPVEKRIPPFSRQSPDGLYAPNADVWGFALVVLALLTGVDPLFSDEGLRNDFGSGPILKKFTETPNSLDWERNIADHIVFLLSRGSDTLTPDESSDLLRLCSRCLVNDCGKRSATAEELLEDPIFDVYRSCPFTAEKDVEKWLTSRINAMQ